MPIFEYSCKDCGKQFEAFVTADRTPSCPGCQSEKLASSSPALEWWASGRLAPRLRGRLQAAAARAATVVRAA